MSSEAGTKRFEYELAIDARPEDVWRAISDGDELQRWFPISARMKPGLGGSVFLSWGPACEGEAPIVLWEPHKRIVWKEQHAGGVEISVMFEIEPAKGNGGSETTVIRITQSGFGRGANWDNMYDSISSGWKFELRSLRHYLRRHPGKDRACVWLPVRSGTPGAAEAWKRLTAQGAAGLCRAGSIGGHAEGGAYELTGPDGRTYSGTVVRALEQRVFAGTVHELDDALMRIELEPGGEGGCSASPTFWLSGWGRDRKEIDEIGASWKAGMERVLG